MSFTSRTNPYRPGVGLTPLYLAGRDDSIRRFEAVLRSAPALPANMRITGLRGVGKTVLLNQYSLVARHSQWLPSVIELQPGHNTEPNLKRAIQKTIQNAREQISTSERLRKGLNQIVSSVGEMAVSWQDITMTLGDVTQEDIGFTQSLFDITKLAVDKGHAGYILLMDEAQVIKDDTTNTGEHPLSMLISCISMLQRNNVPIGLVLCGLPTLRSNLLKARSYTERMFRGEKIDSLETDAALQAFLEPLRQQSSITATTDLAERVVEEVEGYPYFIQLWGAELWDAAIANQTPVLSPELLQLIRPEIYRRLDFDFYEPRLDTLRPAEQDLLLDTVGCSYPPIIVSDLKDQSLKSPKNINVLLGRMVESGVLYRLRKGQYEYTAPKFRQYLERHPQ